MIHIIRKMRHFLENTKYDPDNKKYSTDRILPGVRIPRADPNKRNKLEQKKRLNQQAEPGILKIQQR